MRRRRPHPHRPRYRVAQRQRRRRHRALRRGDGPALTADRLHLEPHPEGGRFRRTWTSPVATETGRPAASAILFLLTPGERSAWHAVDADELWLWHGPGTLTLLIGDAPGETAERRVLGPDDVQVLVPAGRWQATEPVEAEVLVSCVVSPGFEWSGFRLG